MADNKTIFLTGGTGRQGGAVARKLSNHGFTVIVLARDPHSPGAQKLQHPNIQLVKGDLNKPDTYREYVKSADGVFCVLTYLKGVKKEITQGIALVDQAKECGVKHFVYSSVVAADLKTGAPHMESKNRIEKHIRMIGIPFTIIRPTSLYENFLIPQVKGDILKGKLVQPVNRDTILQYISVEDIGNIATRIFQNRDLYLNKIMTLAAEQLSTREVAQIFSKALNEKVEYRRLPSLLTRLIMGSSVYQMFKWMDQENRMVVEDLNFTRSQFTDLLSLESWISRHFMK